MNANDPNVTTSGNIDDEPCLCWTDFTCLARDHDPGCYICRPDDPTAAEEGCEACDQEYWAHVLSGD